jgi:hypothetical protein
LPLVIALAVLGLGFGKNIGLLLREPAATANLHPLTGLVSNLGVLLWCTTSSICVFAGLLVRRHGDLSGTANLLLSAGCLSGYLMLDDAFQIHEDLAARYFGIGEMYVYAALGLAAFWYLIRYRKLIVRTDIRLLALAIAFFSVSVAIDALFEPWLHGFGQGRILLEDGTKWIGICAWCGYHVQVAFESLLRCGVRLPAAAGTSALPPLARGRSSARLVR